MFERFQVHAVAEDGSQSVVDATDLIISVGDGKELQICLRNYGGKGELTMLSGQASIILRPGACNLLRISLEALPDSCDAGDPGNTP